MTRSIFIFLWAITLLFGCSAKNRSVAIQYSASSVVNPDIHQQPSPVVVTTYQLKSMNAFKNADFYSLYDNAKSVLGDDLLTQEQVEIKPGDTFVSSQTLLPQTKFIAAIAAYCHIDNAIWQGCLPVSKIKSKKMTILLHDTELNIQS